MKNKENLILVDGSVLPEIFHKVIQANQILSEGQVRTVGEAAKRVGLSRSAYYKYKDSVRPFYDLSDSGHGRIMTILFIVQDKPGILSNILNLLAGAGASVLTINQNIPVNGIASISISFKTLLQAVPLQELMDSLRAISGVKKLEIMSRE